MKGLLCFTALLKLVYLVFKKNQKGIFVDYFFIFSDPDNKGQLIDDYWAPGQKMMGDIKFLDTLKAYDKDNIPKHIMKTIREKYVNNPYFDPNLVKKVQFFN